MQKTMLTAALIVAAALSGCGNNNEEATRAELNPPDSAYTSAPPCSEWDEKCVSMLDYLTRKPGFKERLLSELTKVEPSNKSVASWSGSSKLFRRPAHGESYVLGLICDTSDCKKTTIAIAYNEDSPNAFGIDQHGNWFGDKSQENFDLLCANSGIISCKEIEQKNKEPEYPICGSGKIKDYIANHSIQIEDRPSEILKRIGTGCNIIRNDFVAASTSGDLLLMLSNARCDALGEGWHHLTILKNNAVEILGCAFITETTMEIKVFENGNWSNRSVKSDPYKLTPLDYYPK